MITKNKFYLKMIFTACICAIILTGCGSKYTVEEKSLVENQKENQETLENGVNRTSMEKSMEFSDESTEKIPEIVEVDWSEYFNGLNGTAVIYDASNKKYTILYDIVILSKYFLAVCKMCIFIAIIWFYVIIIQKYRVNKRQKIGEKIK